MTPDYIKLAQERFRRAMEMYEAAEAEVRREFRQNNPDATEDEVYQHVIAWREYRPGAEHGDADGIPVPWPRRRSESSPDNENPANQEGSHD